jgi:hypothetical protein
MRPGAPKGIAKSPGQAIYLCTFTYTAIARLLITSIIGSNSRLRSEQAILSAIRTIPALS